MIPSVDALWRHWLRSCWGTYGWKLSDGDRELSIDWNSEHNIEQVQYRVFLLTKGCKCKCGCVTSRCGCCSEVCSCQHCSNILREGISDSTVQDLEIEENKVTDDEDSDTENIVESVFGESHSDYEKEEN